MPPEAPPAALRLTVDRGALAANWRALDARSGAARAGAAVKANAYGVGAALAVPVLRDAGCADFFVAHWGEVPEVLRHVPGSALAVLHGPLTAADAAFARACGVRPVINSLAQARRWIEAGGGACDLMVDTGMNRLGVALDELGDPLLARLEIDILLSHLVAAEDETLFNDRQRQRWDAARQALPHRRASLANSAGIALGAPYHGDLTRPGIALYGGVPCTALADAIRPVVRPEAAIIAVRQVAAGETIGYNATFTAPAPMRIGVVGLGYADGYLRCWSDKGVMRADGQALPVIGRVSMDMSMIDLGAAPHLREGDWVAPDYLLPEAAARSGLSQYELLTVLGKRLAR